MTRKRCRLAGVFMAAVLWAGHMIAWAQSVSVGQAGSTGVAGASDRGNGLPEDQGKRAKPRVEPIVSMQDRPAGAPAAPAHKKSNLTLSSTDWTDTGVTVAAGETAELTASGSFSLGDGRTAGPDGVDRGWKDLMRVFPLNSAKVGELVGRVSDVEFSVPFPIGKKAEVGFPTSGRRFLRVSASSDLSGAGGY